MAVKTAAAPARSSASARSGRDAARHAALDGQTASRSASADKPEKAIRQQLERILSSVTFQQVERLKRFISFIVTEAAAGRSDELKEYVVGVQVFGKEHSFDPRTDPIVRVQARRLRARLSRYYHEEGQHDELIIELPKGGMRRCSSAGTRVPRYGRR